MKQIGYDWDEIREQLAHDIQVWYTKKEDVNRQREEDKEKTIEWIIGRMEKGPQLGGVRRGPMPDYTYTFGSLWEPVSKAVRMRYPVCQICGERLTVEVHHIRPRFLRGAEEDPCNLIGLCVECHDEVHRRMDEGISKVIEDAISWTPKKE